VEVELGGSLLSAKGPDILLLLSICAFGFMERHRIVTHDRAQWEQWAQELPATLSEELRLVWDDGEQRSAVGAAAERIEVRADGHLTLYRDRITVNPQEAVALLGRPLRILLENGRTDRLFLLAFADRPTRALLERAEQAGWLVFETAGGIGELRLRLAQDDASDVDALRLLYLCDSDARKAGAYSSDAADVRDAIERLAARFSRGVTYFGRVLDRRSAENYAPPREVLLWAKRDMAGRDTHSLIEQSADLSGRVALSRNPGAAQTPRRRLLAALALKELPLEIRAYIDMKEGRGDSPEFRTVDAIWDQLDEFQQAVLSNGFGKKFAPQFYESSSGLSDENGEMAAILRHIAERL